MAAIRCLPLPASRMNPSRTTGRKPAMKTNELKSIVLYPCNTIPFRGGGGTPGSRGDWLAAGRLHESLFRMLASPDRGVGYFWTQCSFDSSSCGTHMPGYDFG